ncbi:MAG: integrase arm-type DNA-binding domain-containing protein [Azoarcus sp.]|nr:integrase arm-type DNA-binding domain-containing protein [Azoarcus sp.]
MTAKPTDTIIMNAKPAAMPVKLTDEKGLYLLVPPSGGKLWRMRYRFEGKEKLLAFGKYPGLSLKEARERRDEDRKLLANGADPEASKTAIQERAADTFAAVAGQWFEKWKTEVTDSTAESQWNRLEEHIMPVSGTLPVAEIAAPDVMAALAAILDPVKFGQLLRAFDCYMNPFPAYTQMVLAMTRQLYSSTIA